MCPAGVVLHLDVGAQVRREVERGVHLRFGRKEGRSEIVGPVCTRTRRFGLRVMACARSGTVSTMGSGNSAPGTLCLKSHARAIS